MKDKNLKYIGFHIPKALYEKIEKLAKEDDRKIANLIRLWVKEAVEKREGTDENK